MKLCIFGDSVGKGVTYDNGKQRYTTLSGGFVSVLEEKLNTEIDNFCRFGCTLTKGIELIERRMDRLSQYDYVALEFGGNDSDFDWAAVAADPEGEHDCFTPMESFTSSYINIIDRIRAEGSNPILLSVPAIDSMRYYKWISKSNDGNAIMQFLREPMRIERWNEMYNNAVWRIGSLCSVPVLDIRTPILHERYYKELFCEDGIHPNSEAHSIIADSIYEKIALSVR